jgi:hypothetical protein
LEAKDEMLVELISRMQYPISRIQYQVSSIKVLLKHNVSIKEDSVLVVKS